MSTDQNSYNEIIGKSSKIAICTPSIQSHDLASSITILFQHLNEQGKQVSIYSTEKIPDSILPTFSKYDITVENTLKPVTYVVSIDYGQNGIEKISYDPDEKSGRLNFFITPSKGEFDFENIEYRTEGNEFDTVITFGASSYKDLGELYENNRKLFSSSRVISVVKGDVTLGDSTVHLTDEEEYISAVKMMIGESMSKELASMFAELLFENLNSIEMVADGKLLTQLSELSEQSVDLPAMIQKRFYSKNFANLDLQIKLMQHVTIDRANRVIWSKLNYDEVKYCGVNENNIDLNGRILFNISDEFDLAFAVYEIKKENLLVVVESNDTEKYDASKIAGVFGGEGSANHAQFTIKNILVNDFEKSVFLVLSDMYQLQIKGKGVDFKTSNDSQTGNVKITPPRVDGVEK